MFETISGIVCALLSPTVLIALIILAIIVATVLAYLAHLCFRVIDGNSIRTAVREGAKHFCSPLCPKKKVTVRKP